MSSQKDKAEATIEVPSRDPPKDKNNKEDNAESNALSGVDEPKDPKQKKAKKDENELSVEDEELRKRLEELVDAILDSDYDNVAQSGLNLLKNEIRSATSSMTSVPKPLKFLKNDYSKIKSFYTKTIVPSKDEQIISAYSDLMSILAMTMEDPQSRLCLKYRLESGIKTMCEWGTQYLKHLAAEIRIEYETRLLAEDDAEKTAGFILCIREMM